jgi:3',5'-nucleoside bisphosphate phosphatase
MIDLHCHSYFSDGALSPEDLIQKAMAAQLRCLSLTDHDTLAGYERLYQAASSTPIKVICGIELSARWKKHDIHILGYELTPNEALNAIINRQKESRILRAQLIGEALEKSGLNQAYQKAGEIAGHERIGRPHFARVLMNEGRVRDMQAAFKQYLGRGKSAYVPTPWIDIQEAVETIVQSGGKAVIAHPFKYGLTRTKLHELINLFIDVGGVGIEVVSGDMTSAQIKEMAATCLRFHLLASSGSDYHGDAVSRTALGGQPSLPEGCTPIWQEWNI